MAAIGIRTRHAEAIQVAVYMAVFPLTLVSSVFLPTQTMPGWLQAFANHQPTTTVANAIRGLVLGGNGLAPGQTVAGQTLLALAWTAAIVAVFAPLAVHFYRRSLS